jgi:catechol 2,3-dioxygenase-like lactoylglutathione lyase family enzyme
MTLSRFDHVTLAVKELDSAVASYERLLGRPPTWRGEQADSGSRAALFTLANCALELIAPRAEALEAEGLRALLEARGEGLCALVFGSDDADACFRDLRARGVAAAPPEPGQATSADGTVRTFRTLELSQRRSRNVPLFIVERPDATALRSREPVEGSVLEALDHVVLRTADADAAVALYGPALGLRLALDRDFRGVRMLFFRLGGVTLEVVEDRSLQGADVLHGLAYRVRDLESAHARMRASGLEVDQPRSGNKPGTRVFTVRSGTCGVPTLVISDPSRG